MAGHHRLMRLLLGDWSRPVRGPIDFAQLSILAGAVYWFAGGNASNGARFLLTWIVLVVVSRVIRPPRVFDLLFFIGMSLQAWGNAGAAFQHIPYYDRLVHGILTAAIASLIYIGLVRLHVMFDPKAEDHHPRHAMVGMFLATMAFGMAVGVLYEIYEYAVDSTFGADTLIVGYQDTIFDLVMDTVGGAGGGLLLALWAAKGWSSTRRMPERVIERGGRRGSRASGQPIPH